MSASTNRHPPAFVVALTAAIVLWGCASKAPAPVSERAPLPASPPSASVPTKPAAEPDWRPKTYTVKRGDTLYQIALDHGLDYRELAAWNNIENINRISVGQVLVLSPPGQAGPGGVVTTPLAAAPPVTPSGADSRPAAAPLPSGRGNTSTFKTEPRAIKMPYSDQALAQMQQLSPMPAPSAAAAPAAAAPATAAPAAAAPTTAAPAAAPAAPASAPPAIAAAPANAGRVPEIDDEKLDWIWPATGRIVSGFSETATLKGIDIAGKSGQPVVASAAGKVVYAGTGLRGYGKLIIVKHNATFLSAYAHNKEIEVKEGQQVAKGQKIAEMGDTDADQVKLHFEIRRLGKPVDPTRYLPPA
jgi:lipoprotein NlpD